MKIDKIQCDICGKTVDYNDKKIGNMLSNRSFNHDQPCIDRGFYDRFKVNKLTMCGITKIKNVDENMNPNCENNVEVKKEECICHECEKNENNVQEVKKEECLCHECENKVEDQKEECLCPECKKEEIPASA